MTETRNPPRLQGEGRGIVEDCNNMSKLDRSYETHLVVRKSTAPPGGEWTPRSPGWSLIQVESGMGYWLQAQSSIEIEAGTVLLVASDVPGRIRASQLNGLSLHSFNVIPVRLTGLITLGEQSFLNQASTQSEFAFRVYSAFDPIAVKMRELFAGQNGGGLAFRLALLELFVEVFGKELKQTVITQENTDARERLRLFLREMPPEALLEMSFDKLAQTTHCTPRHLSRIFNDLVGMSFRDKRAEIQLGRARELLATSQSKIVEVALESGYKSLSLFNLMFTRHFGTSPGRWREKYRNNGNTGGRDQPRNDRARRFRGCPKTAGVGSDGFTLTGNSQGAGKLFLVTNIGRRSATTMTGSFIGN